MVPPDHTETGGTAAPAHEQGRRREHYVTRRPSKNWPNSGGRAWRRVRAYVLTRDGGVCQLNLDGCTHTATQAHHLDPRWKYGDDPARIIAACNPCNQKAGSPDVQPEPKRVTRW